MAWMDYIAVQLVQRNVQMLADGTILQVWILIELLTDRVAAKNVHSGLIIMPS